MVIPQIYPQKTGGKVQEGVHGWVTLFLITQDDFQGLVSPF